MYKVVNYDYFQSYPEVFSKFNDAFMFQQVWDLHAIIEDWSTGERVVVWDPSWENISFQENLGINITTPNEVQ